MRDTALLGIRPLIPAVEALRQNDVLPKDSQEFFLHTVLRPILKLQDPVLVSLCVLFLAKYRSTFLQKSRAEQEAFLTTSMKKDTALRSLLIGVCVGQFTTEEMEYYSHSEHQAEMNKRIIELAARRVADALPELIASKKI
ncbi:MAG: hypothetical protein EAZ92_10600 [Candidatus Kapaibacterium sp.]|nr:MAG: hypothetical protein EAZ92_10600 [Candidatus Kapabacteria bacterium]